MAIASFYMLTIKTVVSLKTYCRIVQVLMFHIVADRCEPVLVLSWHCLTDCRRGKCQLAAAYMAEEEPIKWT